MVGALSGVVVCARCGGPVTPGAASCTRCAAPLTPAAEGTALGAYSVLLAGVRIADLGRRRAAVAVDVLVLFAAAAVVAAVILIPPRSQQAIVAAALVLAALLAIELLLAGLAGRSLGRLVFGLRAVDDLTGEPRGPFRRGRPLIADLRRGRDPVAPAVGGLPAGTIAVRHPGIGATDAGVPAGWGDAARTRPEVRTSPSVTLDLDSGERVDLHGRVLIGRVPVDQEASGALVYAWADLSRSLARTHAHLEWSGTTLWVTDLGSRTGTSLVAPDGSRQPLAAGLRGAAAPGWTVELGSRRIEVRDSGIREDQGAQ